MGMNVSSQIWQQFVDLVFQDDLIKHKQNFDVIMDDTFIHSTAEEHMDDLMDLFKVLRKYGLKISPHKCQFFKKKIVYMGLEFQIQKDKVCYTPLKDKCNAIRNLESPKTLRQTRAFCNKTKTLDTTTVKRKHGRPPKPKPQILISKPRTLTAAKNLTTRPQQHPRSLNNKIVSRQMIDEINAERAKVRQVNSCKIKCCQTIQQTGP